MGPVFGPVDLEGSAATYPPVASVVAVAHLEEAQLVSPLFRVAEAQGTEDLFVIGAVATLDDAVLPGGMSSAQAVFKAELVRGLLEGGSSLRVSGVLHGEVPGVVCPDEVKGGSRSIVRRKNPASVCADTRG